MEKIEMVAKVLDDAIAKDIEIIDMQGVSPFVDYMVVCTGNSDRHVDGIKTRLKKEFLNSVKGVEGSESNEWVLVDLKDVVIHIFQEDERIRYSIEKLWGNLPRLNK